MTVADTPIDFETHRSTLARGRGGRVTGRTARGVHAVLAQEAYDAALLVTVTGSVVNAIVSGNRPQLRTTMAAYLPAPPMLFPSTVSVGTAAHALPSAALQNMIAFYGLVTFARSATLGYSTKREPGGVSGPVSMETLAEAWQAAAMQAIGVLTSLGFLDKPALQGLNSRDAAAPSRLVEMLWSVTLGRTPCVRIDGAVIIPGWIERRTHLRREINAPATLHANGHDQHVLVRDLSAGGIGLEGGGSLQPGDPVSVSIGNGVSFEGKTVWNRDGRVGVKLTNAMAIPVSAD